MKITFKICVHKILGNKKYILPFFTAGSFIATPLVALAQSACHSRLAGYCFQPATVYAGIEFLGDVEDVSGIFLALFRWGLIFAALCAFVMITFGGVEYLVAGDNHGRTTDAKKKILNAVMGLVLALTSWLILSTINPELTNGWTVNMPKLELQRSGEAAG